MTSDPQFVEKLLTKQALFDGSRRYVTLGPLEKRRAQRIGLPRLNQLALLQDYIGFTEIKGNRLYLSRFNP